MKMEIISRWKRVLGFEQMQKEKRRLRSDAGRKVAEVSWQQRNRKSRREEFTGMLSAKRGAFAARLRVLAPGDSQVVRS